MHQTDNKATEYRGRFAPSPSGALHFGSLVAALGSYLDAKAQQGKWLVRMEDIDTPRVQQGADSAILHTLEAYGLHWDESVSYQSQRHSLYQDLLAQLASQHLLYACQCTRKQIKQTGGIYQGTCRALNLSQVNKALRLKQTQPIYRYADRLQGEVTILPAHAEEDYIVKRSDGLYAYQLVVVADDIEQQITHVVRGADLLQPTARQISLFTQLNYRAPHYLHLPLAVAKAGLKLSKQNHVPAIDNKNPVPTLVDALYFLGLNPPASLLQSTVSDVLTWGVNHWQVTHLRHCQQVQISQNPQGQTQFVQLA